MSKYVWCEDTGAGYEFWLKIFEALDKDIIVRSKKNNTELRKAVERVTDDGNSYYIFMDAAMDNSDVLRETQRVNKIAEMKKNVFFVKIHSFEYSLLSFKKLEDWVFAKEDELKTKRTKFLAAREIFLRMVAEGISPEEQERFFELTKYDVTKNSEQLASSLIKDITKNTGFATTKSKLGECFVEDCCTWTKRQADDICGLDGEHLNSETKRKTIVMHSALQNSLSEVGLL